jgi:hypothetical protein
MESRSHEGWPDDFEKKVAQNVAQPIFGQNPYTTFTVEKAVQNFVLLLQSSKTAQSQQSTKRQKFAQSCHTASFKRFFWRSSFGLHKTGWDYLCVCTCFDSEISTRL